MVVCTVTPNGITLIALIITIVIMLILAGVAISIAISGGIFSQASAAAEATRRERAREAVNLLLHEYTIEKATKKTAFMDFFELKEKAGEIDGVTNDGVLENGKNQYTIEKDGYYFEIIDEIIQNIYDADIIIKFEYPDGTKGPIAKAKVTVGNNKKTVDTSSIEYGWTSSREETPEVWEGTTSGAEITKDITGSEERYYLHVRAKAVGETEYTTKISSQFNDLDETEPEITLTKTEGDEEVTITANVTFGFTGGTVKWLSGDKAVEDFAEAGTEINEPYSFKVTKNGWYTVYGEGSNGLKKVSKIEVTTIVIKPKTFNYTGAIQIWTAPATGNYKIEAWGAAGSNGGFAGGLRWLRVWFSVPT